MSTNDGLITGKDRKRNEFYTTEKDIHEEIIRYRDLIKGKHIYCNCDDANWSNFWWYFYSSAHILGIASITATCYNENGHGEYWRYSTDNPYSKDRLREEERRRARVKEETEEDIITCEMFDNVEHKVLEGNGDFRSEECVELLKEADIVITNPPFSLFREYVAQLMDYEKKFLILGNMNAITYKEIFPLIKDNKIWFGFGFNMSCVFKTPYESELESNQKFVKSKGFNPENGYIKAQNITWFTNVENGKRNIKEEFYSKYDPSKYPHYDNYDAIECKFVANIPADYTGVIGVPITFLDHYCPDQFEIIGGFNGYKECDEECGLICGTPTEYYDKKGKLKIWNGPTVNKETKFYRILIRWKPEAMPAVKANGLFSYDY